MKVPLKKLPFPDLAPKPAPIETILAERGSRYGEFADNSSTSIALQAVLETGTSSEALLPYHRYALQMISGKLARIVNGDPDYEDNWVDIIGYAELVLKEIRKSKETQQ